MLASMFPRRGRAHRAGAVDPACEEGGDRRGSGTFDGQLAALADEEDRARDLSVGDGDDALQPTGQEGSASARPAA